VRGISTVVPGVGLANSLFNELCGHGTERLEDPSVAVPDIKPAGESIGEQELAEIQGWLGELTEQYGGLAEKLDRVLELQEHASDTHLMEQIQSQFDSRADLAQEFTQHQRHLEAITLDLRRVEDKLGELFHLQHKSSLDLRAIKEVLLDSPMFNEWQDFRRNRPEVMRQVADAEEAMRKGQRADGEKQLFLLLEKEYGIGKTILARHLGLHHFANGEMEKARKHLTSEKRTGPTPTILTHLSTQGNRDGEWSGWRALPRGFEVDNRYRVIEEIGRGGMASVYHVIGIDFDNTNEEFALKVPAPALMDGDTGKRFINEILIAKQLSHPPQPNIVTTFGHVHLVDPYSKKRIYGLVMELVVGQSLAQLIAEKRASGTVFSCDEIRKIVQGVCEGLRHAHQQKNPILHRDVKPNNVMLQKDGTAKLMDFGIARILEDKRDSRTRTGTIVGTLTYMPPEMISAPDSVDARTDVYLVGNLLVELLTLDPNGTPDLREDCPPDWLDLIADAMNRIRPKRPPTIDAFITKFVPPKPGEVEKPKVKETPKPPIVVPPPPPPPVEIKTHPVGAKFVDPTGKGDFKTISEAVTKSPPGSQIFIRPGIYREHVKVEKHLTLIGDGNRADIRIEAPEGEGLTLKGGPTVVRNLTIAYNKDKSKTVDLVIIRDGHHLLEDCLIEQSSRDGVFISHDKCHATMRGCIIRNVTRYGVFAYQAVTVLMEKCISEDHYQGAALIGTCECHLKSSKFLGTTTGGGIHLLSGGKTFMTDCDIQKNHSYGVGFSTDAIGEVRNSRITHNDYTAFYFSGGGKLTIEDSDIRNNPSGGFANAKGATVNKRNCQE